MTKKETVIDEIKEMPDQIVEEILDFVQFLKAKSMNEKLKITMASEPSLRKDWLKPEEDKAWQNL
ncbi:MAG: DUF2281 domain-containing protein [Elusimicrobia bacterium CG1_02_37_114]|nr:MAG: DUF2281 domain-containing protein [Elusimicrobia bacterium CG1_02_37_114]PIV53247.1 MAG: DUF2281 domain-containing protein [Elusimicrobia bacterium CG02_land_8_20_14_3_00_37_13]